MSSGYSPIAATLVHERIYDAIYQKETHYVHGHTYGGNPLSCAVALAVQNYIEDHNLVERCARMGDLMLEQMKALEELPIVGEVRGKGLLLGAEFVADKETRAPFAVERGVTAMVVNKMFDRGVLIMPGAPGLIDGVAGDHIAVSPPFTINAAEVKETVDVMREVILEVGKELGY